MREDRFSRNELMFGREGQEKISSCKVAIVGLGGIGCHVSQQLAYLGTKDFYLIDSDRVTASNLNRLFGAVPADVENNTLKVDVAERVILSATPDANVQKVDDTFICKDGFEVLGDTDVVFGCVDGDGSRLILNEFCSAHKKPYIDLATEIYADSDPLTFGGRVVVSINGDGCLSCLKVLSQEDIRRELSSPEQREEDDRLYGMDRTDLDQTGPSVVSLNGLIASAATIEFKVMVTGIRSPQRLLTYHGHLGIITTSRDKPQPNCYYCKEIYGKGEAADAERYLRSGVGEYVGKR